MGPEFDKYAVGYDELLRDPIRDRFAKRGDFFHLRKWLLLRAYLETSGVSLKESNWLDVGCGKGELLRFGRQHFAHAHGCDPSEAMLRDCSDLPVTLQTDSTALPFPDGSFQLVTAACVYHHLNVREREALTNEARRVLTPGGVFAIFEHNPWNPATRVIVSRTPVDANAVLLTAREARGFMARAGLEKFDVMYYLYFPEALFVKFGGLERRLASVPAGGQYAVFGRRVR